MMPRQIVLKSGQLIEGKTMKNLIGGALLIAGIFGTLFGAIPGLFKDAERMKSEIAKDTAKWGRYDE